MINTTTNVNQNIRTEKSDVKKTAVNATINTGQENRKTNHFLYEIAEITRKRIEHLSSKYETEIPEEIKSVWKQILK